MLGLAIKLAANIDVASVRVHGEGRQQRPFHQLVRIEPHDLAVLAGAGLALVGVDDKVIGPPVLGFPRHEGPLHAGGEPGAAATAQARFLHLVDDPLRALVHDRLGAVPVAAPARAVEAPVFQAIEVGVDAILVGKHAQAFFSVSTRGPEAGAAPGRPIRDPGLGVLPALMSATISRAASGVRSS